MNNGKNLNYKMDSPMFWKDVSTGPIKIVGVPSTNTFYVFYATLKEEIWLYEIKYDLNGMKKDLRGNKKEEFENKKEKVAIKMDWPGCFFHDFFPSDVILGPTPTDFYLVFHEAHSIMSMNMLELTCNVFAGHPDEYNQVDGPLQVARFELPLSLCYSPTYGHIQSNMTGKPQHDGTIFVSETHNASLRMIKEGMVSTFQVANLNKSHLETVLRSPKSLCCDTHSLYISTDSTNTTTSILKIDLESMVAEKMVSFGRNKGRIVQQIHIIPNAIHGQSHVLPDVDGRSDGRCVNVSTSLKEIKVLLEDHTIIEVGSFEEMSAFDMSTILDMNTQSTFQYDEIVLGGDVSETETTSNGEKYRMYPGLVRCIYPHLLENNYQLLKSLSVSIPPVFASQVLTWFIKVIHGCPFQNILNLFVHETHSWRGGLIQPNFTKNAILYDYLPKLLRLCSLSKLFEDVGMEEEADEVNRMMWTGRTDTRHLDFSSLIQLLSHIHLHCNSSKKLVDLIHLDAHEALKLLPESNVVELKKQFPVGDLFHYLMNKPRHKSTSNHIPGILYRQTGLLALKSSLRSMFEGAVRVNTSVPVLNISTYHGPSPSLWSPQTLPFVFPRVQNQAIIIPYWCMIG